MPDHRYALSAEVHEPKHITDSTPSDSGKVITASTEAPGASVFRYLDPSDVGIVFAYGEMDTDNNAVSFSATAATDPTLQDPIDYIPLVSARVPATVGEQFNVDFNGTANTLDINVGGVYRLSGWFNIKSSVANTKVAVKYTNNGIVSGGKLVMDVKDADRTENLSGFGMITLYQGDSIGVSLAADKTSNITVTDMRVGLELVRGI